MKPPPELVGLAEGSTVSVRGVYDDDVVEKDVGEDVGEDVEDFEDFEDEEEVEDDVVTVDMVAGSFYPWARVTEIPRDPFEQ